MLLNIEIGELENVKLQIKSPMAFLEECDHELVIMCSCFDDVSRQLSRPMTLTKCYFMFSEGRSGDKPEVTRAFVVFDVYVSREIGCEI